MANNAIVTQGSSITLTASGGTPVTAVIEDATSFTGPSYTRNEIDVTTLASTAKEYKLGLKDPGQFSVDVNFNIWDDAGQELAYRELNSNTPMQVEVRYPGTPERGFDFDALVLNFEPTSNVDDRATGTITFRVTGEPARVPAIVPAVLDARAAASAAAPSAPTAGAAARAARTA